MPTLEDFLKEGAGQVPQEQVAQADASAQGAEAARALGDLDILLNGGRIDDKGKGEDLADYTDDIEGDAFNLDDLKNSIMDAIPAAPEPEASAKASPEESAGSLLQQNFVPVAHASCRWSDIFPWLSQGMPNGIPDDGTMRSVSA